MLLPPTPLFIVLTSLQSQAIATPHAVYCSGCLPATPSGELVTTDMTAMTKAALSNLSATLEAAGSSLDKIVKAQIYLVDMADFKEMNGEYERWITHRPARTCVAVKELPRGVRVEVDCVALP